METNYDPNIISTIIAVNLEFNIYLFYAEYIAFGFTFSGSGQELMELVEDIRAVKTGWEWIHRN